MRSSLGRLAIGLLFVASCAGAFAPTHAINVVIDYSYDTGNFFGSGNPQGAAGGAQARATLEFAADFFSDVLADTFSTIETPPTFYSQVFNGSVGVGSGT